MKINCAAIERDGVIWSGKNHAEIIKQIIKEGKTVGPITQQQQGFLTDEGDFVSRRKAYNIARKANQLKHHKGIRLLMSEDLIDPGEKGEIYEY